MVETSSNCDLGFRQHGANTGNHSYDYSNTNSSQSNNQRGDNSTHSYLSTQSNLNAQEGDEDKGSGQNPNRYFSSLSLISLAELQNLINRIRIVIIRLDLLVRATQRRELIDQQLVENLAQ